MKTYYLIMQRGTPIDVCTMYKDAEFRAKERSVPGNPATIKAVTDVQMDLFDDKPTDVEGKYQFGHMCADARNCTCG